MSVALSDNITNTSTATGGVSVAFYCGLYYQFILSHSSSSVTDIRSKVGVRIAFSFLMEVIAQFVLIMTYN